MLREACGSPADLYWTRAGDKTVLTHTHTLTHTWHISIWPTQSADQASSGHGFGLMYCFSGVLWCSVFHHFNQTYPNMSWVCLLLAHSQKWMRFQWVEKVCCQVARFVCFVWVAMTCHVIIRKSLQIIFQSEICCSNLARSNFLLGFGCRHGIVAIVQRTVASKPMQFPIVTVKHVQLHSWLPQLCWKCTAVASIFLRGYSLPPLSNASAKENPDILSYLLKPWVCSHLDIC